MDHSSPTRRWRRTAMVSAAFIAATALLAGCAAGTPPAPTSAPDNSPAADEVISLKVARGAVTIENSILTYEEGFFEEEGLDVELGVTGGGGGAATNSALISGEMDIAATDAVTAVRAINEQMPIVVVAGTKAALPTSEQVSDGLIVPPGSTITEWADLRGKKIGVPELGGLPHLTVVKGLESADIGLDEVEIIPIPMDAITAAAANGQVDAIFSFSVFLLNAVNEGFTRVGNGVQEFLPHAPQVVWVASREFAESNPEALKRFRDALIRGTEFSNSNPDEVRRTYHENTEFPAPFIDNAMVLDTLNVEFVKDGWDTMLQVMKQLAEVRDDLSYEELVWEGAR